MSDADVNQWLNAIAVAGVVGGTGARLNEDLSGERPLPSEAQIHKMDPENALRIYEEAIPSERQKIRAYVGQRLSGAKMPVETKRELVSKFIKLNQEH